MAQGRVQVDELRSDIRLQPTPIQSDTFAAPARIPENQNLARLADALSSFSGSLGRLAERQDDGKDERALMIEQKRFSGLTLEQQRDEVESGARPNYANDFVRKGVENLRGDAYGRSRAAELEQRIKTTHDWGNDPDALYAQVIQEDMGKYGSDPNFVNQYLRQMQAGRLQARGIVEQRRVDDFTKETHTAAFVGMDGVIDAGIKAGKDPEAIAKEVMGSYKVLGKDGVLGVNYDVLDKERLNASARLAETEPETALALLTATRKGRNGSDMSFNSDPETRDRVLRIQAVAQKALAERSEKAFLDGVSKENAGLMASGNLDGIEERRYKSPVTGEEKVLTADAQRDKVVYDYMERSPKIAEENRETGNERIGRELRVFRMGGKNHPEIEKRVSGIFQMAHAGLSQDPEAQDKLVQKLDAYKWLRNESTQSLLSHVKDEKDRDFAETYLAGQTYLGMAPEEAVSFATRATKITSEGMPTISPQQRDEVRRKVNNVGTKPGWLWNSDVKPANSAIVTQRVTTLALGIMNAQGVDMDKAIDMASEAVKATSTTYRGNVLELQGMTLPDNFAEVLDEQLADFAAKSPLMMQRNGISESDLNVIPAGSTGQSGGRFIVTDEDLNPIKDDQGNLVLMTLSQVRQRAAAKENERKDKQFRDAAFNNSVKQRGFEQGADIDGNNYWFDPKTKEIVDPQFDKGASAPTWKKTGKRLKDGNLLQQLMFRNKRKGQLYMDALTDD